MARKALPVARDITEDRLANYADKGFNCMFETPEGLAIGYLSFKNDYDDTLVITCASVGKDRKYDRYAVSDMEIPDNTVIALTRDKEMYRVLHPLGRFPMANKRAIWGVTSFD